MRRHLVALAMIMSLVGAACAGAGSSTDGTGSSSPSTAPSTTGQGSSTTDGGSVAKPEGPIAPDFTLALGEDGSETFVLSEEAKPVYMVFWAEW